ncbi:MAG TPA: peptidylprolyl isomerase [Pirellulales bacterium]|nr:peptidylprolyl isomerase [Pirellulales bacterium]
MRTLPCLTLLLSILAFASAASAAPPAAGKAAPSAAAPAAAAPAASADKAPAESAAAAPADEKAPAPVGDPKATAAEFEKLFGEFKQVLGKLRSLQGKYQLASDKDRPAIEKEFNTQVAVGKEISPKLLAAAKAAFLAAPNANPSVNYFLVNNVAEAVQSDDYPAALELAKLLIAHDFKDPSLYNFAGVAAFGVDEFDLAKDWLTKAQEAKTLSEIGKNDLKVVDEYQKLWPDEQKIREAEAKADDLPRVRITTSKGDIVVELYENEAPIATANFISLVEKHFYDGTPFHRVLPGFMAQGGDPTGTGSGGPGYTIPCECYGENHRNHFSGTLSMAHAGKDTGGSQFFLTFRPTPHLNGMHTVFGRVIEGKDVLSQLERVEPGKPGSPDKIVKAEVIRKRNHEYVPKKAKEKG